LHGLTDYQKCLNYFWSSIQISVSVKLILYKYFVKKIYIFKGHINFFSLGLLIYWAGPESEIGSSHSLRVILRCHYHMKITPRTSQTRDISQYVSTKLMNKEHKRNFGGR